LAELIFLPTGLQTPELEIMLSKAQISIDKGNNVIIATCSGEPGYACSLNIYGVPLICYACRSQTCRGLSLLKGKFTHLTTPSIKKFSADVGLKDQILESRYTLKRYRFNDVDVGQAAYSSYIGLSRDQDLEGRLARFSLKKLLSTSEMLTKWSEIIFESHNISKLFLYNGRQNQYRPVLRVAQKNKISVEVMEFAGQSANCVYTFQNQLPQDIDTLVNKIEFCWESYCGDKLRSASEFFTSKRSGGAVNDQKSYVCEQQEGMIPKGWDSSKRNIVIFNSSEDEFSALGGEYDKTLYTSQVSAISLLCESLRDRQDIIFWLRMHPNLKNVSWSFASQLKHLGSKYKNINVILPESRISTYGLLDICDVAISFGSTMGVEAAYWGKPSILLGRCAYESYHSVYVPTSHAEVVSLICNYELPSLDKEGAYKVGLFWSNGGESLLNFSGNRRNGFKFLNHNIQKSIRSKVSFGIGKFIEKFILGTLINDRFY
jgi:hypothetical protein